MDGYNLNVTVEVVKKTRSVGLYLLILLHIPTMQRNHSIFESSGL